MGTELHPPKGAQKPSPIFFGPCLLWPNVCVILANSGSFRAHCVKVHFRYLISFGALWLRRTLTYLLTPDEFLCNLRFKCQIHDTSLWWYVWGLRLLTCYSAKKLQEASPSIGNTLWRVSTMFTRSAIISPEVNGFGWNLGTPSTLFGSGPDIFWARSAQKRERCFLSGKQRTTLPISGQPNFTKFAHKTWFCDVVNPFGIFFLNLPLRGLFSK